MHNKVKSYREAVFKECPHCGRVALIDSKVFVPRMAMKPEYQKLLEEHPYTTSRYCPEDAKRFKDHQELLLRELDGNKSFMWKDKGQPIYDK